MSSLNERAFAGLEVLQARALELRTEVDLFRLPRGLERLNQLLSAAPVDLRRLGTASAGEAETVACVVRLCNSALFSLSPRVGTLEQAVSVLDAEAVRELLLACWLIRFSGARSAASENVSFWRHSLLVARLSRRIAEWLDYAQPERAFVAGLLHDAGLLPFLTLYSRCGVPNGQTVIEYAGDAVDFQRRRFAADHCELGLKMASILEFPATIAETAARHHQPGHALNGAVPVAFVAAAEAIARSSSALTGMPSAPAGLAIRNALNEYLPGSSPAKGSGFVEVLECELALPPAHDAEAVFPGLGESVFRPRSSSGAV